MNNLDEKIKTLLNDMNNFNKKYKKNQKKN